MKISTRGRYSTRLMLELASKYSQGPIFLKDVSQAQDISLKYLSQLIIPLKIAGLVKSTRGAHGGYTLSRSPEKITLREIVEAVEGPIAMVECINDPHICSRYRHCVSKDIWAEITQDIYQKLDAVTLQDCLERQDNLTP
ncbi:MAG: Rrf2 family transcriptional regulator [Actinomycetota bacterium]|jgi:Rrf2 family protein|nr:Rrf2 family transcriptional regulator [Actinomycetota bacterium]